MPTLAQKSKASRAKKGRAVERRDSILTAALDEFSAQGFEAARMDDVAKRAGIAKGTIYLYFDGKEAVFRALVREMLVPRLNQAADFARIKGLGPAKRAELVAVMEMARRALAQQIREAPVFDSPGKVKDYAALRLGGSRLHRRRSGDRDRRRIRLQPAGVNVA